MNKPITDIQERDGLISFKFMGGGIPDAISSVVSSTPADVTYYTLDGIKLTGQPTTPGLYIEKRNGTTRKVSVKR